MIKVTLMGCDDSTEFALENATAEQIAFLENLAARSTEVSQYSCQPELKITPTTPEECEEDGIRIVVL